MTMTKEKALADYQLCLEGIRELEENHRLKMDGMTAKRQKIESWLLQNCVDLETVPLIVGEDRPFVAWSLTRKTDASAVEAHMQIDDVIIPRMTAAVKEATESLKKGLEVIENWALNQLNERGSNNFNTDFGTVSRMIVRNYKIADKKLFLKDALEGGYESEVTVSVRPNSKLMTHLMEENGELPAGVTMTQIYEARFTKAK